MKNPIIGIKIADGSYFPIMEEGSTKRKRLVLTTVNDNQESVQIDLYKGSDEKLTDAVYVGSLLVENIVQGPKGSSEIELKLGFDKDGTLNAEAGDPGSGQYESLSISMETLGESSIYDTPEFSLDDDMEDLKIDEFDSMEEEQPVPELAEGDDDMEDLKIDEFDSLEEEQPVPEQFDELTVPLAEGDEDIDLSLDDLSSDEELGEIDLDDMGEGTPDSEQFDELTVPLAEGDEDIDLSLDDLSIDDELGEIDLDDMGEGTPDSEQFDELTVPLTDIDDDMDLSLDELSLDEELGQIDLDELDDFDNIEEEQPAHEQFDELTVPLAEGNDEDFEMEIDNSEEEEDPAEDKYTPGFLSESEMVHSKEKKKGNPFLVALLVLVAIAAIAGISYLLFHSLQGEDSPVLEAKNNAHTTESVAPEQEVPKGESAETVVVQETQAEESQPVAEKIAPQTESASANGETQTNETSAVPEITKQENNKIQDISGVWYKIRWGDTLWGISYSFYDSPKDYNEIVKENKIKNPDIIFAETEIFIPSK